jgi:hypothetical protein
MSDFETESVRIVATERYSFGFSDWRFGRPEVLPRESEVSRALRRVYRIYEANDSRNGWQGPAEDVRYD